MAESEAYRKGREIRRQLLGDAYVEQASRTVYTDPMMRKFIDTATETVFGTLWSRPGLDLKTRTMGYVGAPLVREAFITAKKVFAEVREGGKA